MSRILNEDEVKDCRQQASGYTDHPMIDICDSHEQLRATLDGYEKALEKISRDVYIKKLNPWTAGESYTAKIARAALEKGRK